MKSFSPALAMALLLSVSATSAEPPKQVEGAVAGAVGGAVVAGPVGALVGGVGGAVVGHHMDHHRRGPTRRRSVHHRARHPAVEKRLDDRPQA